MALPLHVGCPQASVPHRGKRDLKQLLIRSHLLTQAGGREGYSSHSWDVQGVSAAAEASMKLQESEVHRAFSQGSWPQFTGPSAVVGCTGFWEGVDSDLPCTQDPWQQWWQPLGSKITATACARTHVDIVLPSVSAQSGKLLWWAAP